MVPAVIPDFQDAGLRCFRPPDVTPLIQADNASLVEHRARFGRSDNERRTFRLRPVPPVALAALLEDRIEALDVAEIRMSFDVEIVEVRAVIETQPDPLLRVEPRWRAVPCESEFPHELEVFLQRHVVVRCVVFVGCVQSVISKNRNRSMT